MLADPTSRITSSEPAPGASGSSTCTTAGAPSTARTALTAYPPPRWLSDPAYAWITQPTREWGGSRRAGSPLGQGLAGEAGHVGAGGEGDAAVGGQGLARHPAQREQRQHRIGDVLGLAEPAEWRV